MREMVSHNEDGDDGDEYNQGYLERREALINHVVAEGKSKVGNKN